MIRTRCSLRLALASIVSLAPVAAQHTESVVIPYPELHDYAATFGYRTAEWDGWLAVSQHDAGTVYVYKRSTSGWVLRQSFRETLAVDFGKALDMDAGRLVVGAERWGFPTANRGRVFVYELDEATDEWSLSQTLLPVGLHDDSFYGGSVAIDGDRLVVGAFAVNIPVTVGGCVLFYDHDGVEWHEVNRFTLPENLPDVQNLLTRRLGHAVALEGDRAVAGAPGGPGGVLVYERTGSSWGRTAYLEHPQQEVNGYQFGWSVALQGDTILVGEPRDAAIAGGGSYYPGRASIFEKVGESWLFTAELRPSDGFGGSDTGDEFGRSVGLLERGRAFVGAPQIDVPGNPDPHDGKVYLFEKGASGWPSQETATFTSTTSGSGRLGLSLEVTEGMLLAGPPGNQGGVQAGVLIYHLDDAIPFCEGDGPELEVLPDTLDGGASLVLAATECLPGSSAVFLASNRGVRLPILSGSRLCIGPPILRIPDPSLVGEAGLLYHEINAASPGIAWLMSQGPRLVFQLWTRDPAGNTHFSNASALPAD